MIITNFVFVNLNCSLCLLTTHLLPSNNSFPECLIKFLLPKLIPWYLPTAIDVTLVMIQEILVNIEFVHGILNTEVLCRR